MHQDLKIAFINFFRFHARSGGPCHVDAFNADARRIFMYSSGSCGANNDNFTYIDGAVNSA
jgi:hypothetical protein